MPSLKKDRTRLVAAMQVAARSIGRVLVGSMSSEETHP
jgi:hypothetical protein